MTFEDHYPVLIVGAGPTGITAATLLAQYGIASLTLDRWPGVYAQPRAVHLDDEVVRILDRLGVAGEFAEISRPALGLRLLDPGFAVLAEFRRDPAHTPHGHPQANMFDQPALEALLRANLERFPAASLYGGAEVTDITDLPTGGFRVGFTRRSDGTRHIVGADYLLGCDGANSLVRAHIGSMMRELNFEQRWLVVDIESQTDLGQWGGVHQLCDPQRAGTFMQIGPTRYRWEFRLLPGEDAAQFRSFRALHPLIAPWTGTLGEDRFEIIRAAEYTFRAQVARTWRRGNTFLLGDAAHLTPPFIGQGMCAGLRDAMNLAWKLAGVIGHTLPTEVLDTYEQERKPHASSMIRLALVIGRAMTEGGRIGDALRRAIMPRLSLIPGLREMLLSSVTPPLHRSALVRRSIRGERLAGRLCPNALTPDATRLDTVLGRGFAVVTTEHPDAACRRLVDDRGAVCYQATPDSEIGRWLRRGRARAALVRPDHTVMAAGNDLSRLCREVPALPGG